MSNTDPVTVRILRLAHADGLDLPAYQSAEAAGLDLVCAVGFDEIAVLAPGCRLLVPTGYAIELPRGYEAQVRPRSGLALKHGVTVLNSPGTIDSDYRGEIKVILYNAGDEPVRLDRGARIAQLVIAPVTHVRLEAVESLANSDRGDGGFGSTGTNLPRTS